MTTAAGRSLLRRWRRATAPCVRLLLLPWCGGSAGGYRRLCQLLPPSVDAIAVQLPGREDRWQERPFAHPSELILALAAALVNEHTAQPLPLVLFGHSMGAALACLLAASLPAAALPMPRGLVLSGHAPPDAPADEDIGRWAVTSDDALLDYLRRARGTPERVLDDAGLMRLLLPALRADFMLLGRTRWQVPAGVPLLVCAGRDDPEVPPAALRHWRAVAPCVEIRRFPGAHFYLLHQPDLLAPPLLTWMDTLAPGCMPASP